MTLSGRDPRTGDHLEVEIDNGLITSVGPVSRGDAAWIAPGLVDLQVNGFRGIDVNESDLTAEAVATLAEAQLAEGVTTFLPTVITSSEDRIVQALRTIQDARRKYQTAARAIPFVHVEGPHLSPEDGPRGAHPREAIRPPDIAEFDRWQRACGHLVGMVTLSPHYPGSPAYAAALVARGVRVAVGHTHAGSAAIAAMVDAGATLSTHLGNGAHAELPRHPNYIWSQLAEDRLTATFIADGHHLDAGTFVAMLRAKGPRRSILVSDAVGFAGLVPGVYRRFDGAEVRLDADGRLSLAGTPLLAGAARSLNACVAIAVGLGRITLADAILMATANPGAVVGARGRIAPGDRADLITFDWSPGDTRLRLRNVIAAGRIV